MISDYLKWWSSEFLDALVEPVGVLHIRLKPKELADVAEVVGALGRSLRRLRVLNFPLFDFEKYVFNRC